jgi:mRNA interferase RelE/StbE
MYEVQLSRQATKDIANLPKDYQRLVGQHIDQLAENPRPPDSKKLKGTTEYSLRVGVYRIIYDVFDDTQLVFVYRIKHRREAYR